MRDSHRLIRPLHSAGDQVRARHFHRDSVRLSAPINHLEGWQRKQDEAIERLSQDATLLCDSPDDCETLPDDPDVLANGVHVLEKFLRDVGADDGDIATLIDIDVAYR